jgi:hypothetical protein
MSNETPTKAKVYNYAAIIVLWIGIIFCIKNSLYSWKVITGVIALLISTFLTFKNYKLGFYFTLSIVILGMFGIIDFFPIAREMGYKIGGSKFVSFDYQMFGILFLHYLSNSSMMPLNRDEEEVKESELDRDKIASFKVRFDDRKESELIEIINNQKLTVEARIAANEILKENF